MSNLNPGNCWHCGNELSALDYGRQETCAKCGRDTRTCKNCGFYDPKAHNECHENQAERVVEKERSNFCDYFKTKTSAGSGAPGRDVLKAAADALFKKK